MDFGDLAFLEVEGLSCKVEARGDACVDAESLGSEVEGVDGVWALFTPRCNEAEEIGPLLAESRSLALIGERNIC